MNAEHTLQTLDQFDLLPPSFQYQNRTRQVFCSWLTVVCTLVAVLCGVTAATILRMHQQRQRNQQIAATAIPLLDLRGDVSRLQQENDRRERWCQSVQAARPDDGVLQTLAAIAAASQTEDRAVTIDSVHVRRQIEFPASAEGTPAWAIPHIVIKARVMAEAIAPWLDRLGNVDRIDAVAIPGEASSDTNNAVLAEAQLLDGIAQPIEVTATPLSTRVLP